MVTEYKTIIAPKPVISRVERYKKEKGLPSNSKALAAMTEEMDKNESLISTLKLLIDKIRKMINEIKDAPAEQSQKILASLMDMLHALLTNISKELEK